MADASTARDLASRTSWLLLIAILVGATAVRIDDLGGGTFGHPENFVPGIDVPEWTADPPPRRNLEEVLRTTLVDGHPPLYFVAMVPWVDVFGVSLFSLRLPSALVGVVSVLLLYLIAVRETDRATGVLSALLLAFHGFHMYWSQMARMYSLAACLGLLSTWLLLRARERSSWRFGYGVVSALSLWTFLYCWPLLFAQMVWSSWKDAHRGVPLLKTQCTAIICGSPVIALSLFQTARHWLDARIEFLEAGFLLSRATFFFGSPPSLGIPLDVLRLGLLVFGLGLMVLGFAASRETVQRGERGPSPRISVALWLLALSVSSAIFVFAWAVDGAGANTRIAMSGVAAIPLLLAALFPLIHRWVGAALRSLPMSTLPLGHALGLIPVLCVIGVSVVRPCYTARGCVVLIPYLMLMYATGLRALFRWQAAGVAGLLVAALLLTCSMCYFKAAESSPRDYRGLAEEMNRELRPTDLVFVSLDHRYPPLHFHLEARHDQCIPRDYAQSLVKHPTSRVWVVDLMAGPDFLDAMSEALVQYEVVREVRAYNAAAKLYGRRPR